MSEQWSVPAWAVVVTLLVVLAVAVSAIEYVVRHRLRTTTELAAARDETAALRGQVEAIEQRLARAPKPEAHVDQREYVITQLGDEVEPDLTPVTVESVPAPLFADMVLREGVVQAASLAAGLRRALSPENRMRIRFEMRREVKRARKQRRTDAKQARRDVETTRRAETAT